MQKETAHDHRRYAVNHGNVARIFECLARDELSSEDRRRQRERSDRAGAVCPSNESERRNVEREEEERDAVHAREITALERADLRRKDKKAQQRRHESETSESRAR